MGKSIRIVVADDHAIFREGLRRILEAQSGFKVVGEAADGKSSAKVIRELKPDVAILDLEMPEASGLEALQILSSEELTSRIIMLTAEIQREEMLKALQLGARGFVLKQNASELLMKCIRSVMAGEYWIGRGCVSDLVNALRELSAAAASRPQFGLTPRELEIIAGLAKGFSNKDIAKDLRISESTVKNHLASIFDKAGVFTRTELVLFALKHHLAE